MKENNPAVKWALHSGADAVVASPNDLVLFCAVKFESDIADAKLNPEWDHLMTPEWVSVVIGSTR